MQQEQIIILNRHIGTKDQIATAKALGYIKETDDVFITDELIKSDDIEDGAILENHLSTDIVNNLYQLTQINY